MSVQNRITKYLLHLKGRKGNVRLAGFQIQKVALLSLTKRQVKSPVIISLKVDKKNIVSLGLVLVVGTGSRRPIELVAHNYGLRLTNPAPLIIRSR